MEHAAKALSKDLVPDADSAIFQDQTVTKCLFLSDEGNKEDARRWSLMVRCQEGPEIPIPLRVYSVLKRVEGRLKKVPGRFAPQKRRIDEAATSSAIPAAAAAAAPQEGADEEQKDIELLLAGYKKKVRRMSPELRKAMIKVAILEGDLPPEN